MRIIEWILNWDEIVARGADATVYFVMAAVATLLFLIRLGFAMFGGGDIDADGDLDTDAHTDASFTIFSLLSIMAFFMGTGWMGLACRVSWGLGRLPSALISTGFGATMMFAASGMMYGIRRLNREVRYDPQTAVGRTGRVYLNIPEKGKGHGQVEVTVSGSRKIFRAQSTGPKMAAFEDVVIVEARDDETLIVKPPE